MLVFMLDDLWNCLSCLQPEGQGVQPKVGQILPLCYETEPSGENWDTGQKGCILGVVSIFCHKTFESFPLGWFPRLAFPTRRQVCRGRYSPE